MPAPKKKVVPKKAAPAPKRKPFTRQLQRLRKICLALPGAVEKISHGEPTFFIKKGVFAMFANNHHGDGHVAVWLPAAAGLQSFFMEANPKAYFRPPYVGSAGWIGVELDQIPVAELTSRVHEAWQLIENKKKKK